MDNWSLLIIKGSSSGERDSWIDGCTHVDNWSLQTQQTYNALYEIIIHTGGADILEVEEAIGLSRV